MDFYKAYDLDNRWAIAFTRDFDRAEPVVYFLDKKYKHTNVCGIECQITPGAYYVSTLLGHEDGYDLCLDGGVPAWTVPAETVAIAKKYCQEELQGNGIQNSRKAIKSSFVEEHGIYHNDTWKLEVVKLQGNTAMLKPVKEDSYFCVKNPEIDEQGDLIWTSDTLPMTDYETALKEFNYHKDLNGASPTFNSRKAIKSSREESLALAFDRAEYCCKAIFGSEEGGRYKKWYGYGVSYGQDYAFFKVEHTDYSVRLSFEFMDTGFVYVDAYFTNGSSYDSKTIKNWNFEREVEDETAAGVKEVLDSFFEDGIRILRGEEY